MRKKNSAFCYLYDSIVAQIAAGRFPYGASLPSAAAGMLTGEVE